ncbi:amino acid ABC transporter permease [Lederbergia citrea]|uniref:Amino acid ABC transporter permease n=1 Tax=Lederbergia citrea TaxID=2833581 RepID=A0A942UPW4_9BACI|nr:amino acid ABC transporter permease [Lederbergia citrea]MBS4205891.1 amino acid ABC transporter permease [Lederbergia citrea]MBS4224660.1 amino acid ABC transporter permease [Lederbergia citrea]
MGDIQWQYIFDVPLAIESFPFIFQGIWYTLLISFASMAIGLVIGFFLALGRISKYAILRWPTRIYISFMRGTPMLVFLFLLYFGLPMVGIQFNALTCALIGFSLNSAAYMAEINRSALAAVNKGQWEAAKALGLPYWKTMRLIIIPQATKIAVPPLSNVLLDLIKASSLAAMITVPDLFQRAKIVGGRELDYMTMYILVAFIYWGTCSIVAVWQDRLEKKYQYTD